jgi:hypothetical protein
MRNVSDRNCRKNQNACFMFKNFFSENSAFYEIRKIKAIPEQALGVPGG